MVPTTNTKLEWSSEDAQLLRLFLESETGKRAIAFVADDCPQLLDGGHVNKTLVASGAVKGYSDCLSKLFSLTHEMPEPISESHSAYPSLDDESAWKDSERK